MGDLGGLHEFSEGTLSMVVCTGEVGLFGVDSRWGVLGRLTGVACRGCTGVVGRLGARGVCGRLD